LRLTAHAGLTETDLEQVSQVLAAVLCRSGQMTVEAAW
jgi:hypothetical protein